MQKSEFIGDFRLSQERLQRRRNRAVRSAYLARCVCLIYSILSEAQMDKRPTSLFFKEVVVFSIFSTHTPHKSDQ